MKIVHRCCKDIYYKRNLFVFDEDEKISLLIYKRDDGMTYRIKVTNCPWCGHQLRVDKPRPGKVRGE